MSARPTTSLQTDVARLVLWVRLLRPDLTEQFPADELHRLATEIELQRRWKDRPEQDR